MPCLGSRTCRPAVIAKSHMLMRCQQPSGHHPFSPSIKLIAAVLLLPLPCNHGPHFSLHVFMHFYKWHRELHRLLKLSPLEQHAHRLLEVAGGPKKNHVEVFVDPHTVCPSCSPSKVWCRGWRVVGPLCGQPMSCIPRLWQGSNATGGKAHVLAKVLDKTLLKESPTP